MDFCMSPPTHYNHAGECNLFLCAVSSRRPKYSEYTTSVPAARKQRDSPWTAYRKCICHLTDCTNHNNLHNHSLPQLIFDKMAGEECTMEKMAELMKMMMADVAKQDDIGAIAGRFQKVEGTVQGVVGRLTKMEQEMAGMKHVIMMIKAAKHTATPQTAAHADGPPGSARINTSAAGATTSSSAATSRPTP